MIKINLNKISIEFDTEDTGITEEEKLTLMHRISNIEDRQKDLSLKDKPRVRQILNDEIDTLNKSGDLSDTVAQNITYTFAENITDYIVEARITLTKINTISASSEDEALGSMRSLVRTKHYIDDLIESNDFEDVEFAILEGE